MRVVPGPGIATARAKPEGDVGGLEGAVDDGGQVGADGIEVHGVFEVRSEGGDGLVGIVAGPVEPPVHGVLDAPAQRAEQGRGR